ncbi:Protein air1 [Smittium culicis]|uniref:Protein air1 n=1 Tax=Smittium culicis TaxID=133412 RepID=A0A1R1XQ94_9FUNG|nr:Protein air1 [Smittium culicis]
MNLSAFQDPNDYDDFMYKSSDSEENELDSEEEDKILSHLYYQSESSAIQAIESNSDKLCNNNFPVKLISTENKNSKVKKSNNDKVKQAKNKPVQESQDIISNDSELDTIDHNKNHETNDSKYSISSKAKSKNSVIDLNLNLKNDNSLTTIDSDEEKSNAIAEIQTAPDGSNNILSQVTAETDTNSSSNNKIFEIDNSFEDIPSDENEDKEKESSLFVIETSRDVPTQTLVLDNDNGPIDDLETEEQDYLSDDSYTYLDDANFKVKSRYYVEEKEITCRSCKKSGHIARDCKAKICNNCGKEGHLSYDCADQMVVCHNCNQRGHVYSRCPNPISTGGPQRCYRCSSRYHHSEVHMPKNIYCYNCAEKGHYGDDCYQPFPRWCSFKDDTAFNRKNLPKLSKVHVELSSDSDTKNINNKRSNKSYMDYSSDSDDMHDRGKRSVFSRIQTDNDSSYRRQDYTHQRDFDRNQGQRRYNDSYGNNQMNRFQGRGGNNYDNGGYNRNNSNNFNQRQSNQHISNSFASLAQRLNRNPSGNQGYNDSYGRNSSNNSRNNNSQSYSGGFARYTDHGEFNSRNEHSGRFHIGSTPSRNNNNNIRGYASRSNRR